MNIIGSLFVPWCNVCLSIIFNYIMLRFLWFVGVVYRLEEVGGVSREVQARVSTLETQRLRDNTWLKERYQLMDSAIILFSFLSYD